MSGIFLPLTGKNIFISTVYRHSRAKIVQFFKVHSNYIEHLKKKEGGQIVKETKKKNLK